METGPARPGSLTLTPDSRHLPMFSRRVQDFIVVTVMTVLIWLYAEGANVQTYSPADAVTLDVDLSARDMVIIDQKPQKVSVSFKGSQAELTRLRQELRGTLQLELDLTESGVKSVPMADVIREARPLDAMSVNVTRVEPQTLELQIDRLVQQEVPVVFRPRDVQFVPGSLKIEPSMVTITAPKSRLDNLPDETELVVEATLSQDLRSLELNKLHRIAARLALPPGLAGQPHATLSSTEAMVSFSIGQQEDTVVLPSVPVWRAGPPQTEYTVEYDLHIQNVSVTGPVEDVKKLEQNTDKSLRVIAVLWLGSDELANAAGKGVQIAPVQFNAPPQFKITARNATVRYTVTKNTP